MNESRFRGFHPDKDGEETVIIDGKKIKGTWYYGDLLRDFTSGIYAIVIYVNLGGNIQDLSEINIFKVIPETVGQYTGLTDKNGVRIFEGDIVKTHYANAKKSDFVETVVFHNGKFCAFHSNNGCKQWAMLYDGVKHLSIDKIVYMDSVEIIGNIYDNPELLEEGDERSGEALKECEENGDKDKVNVL